MPNAAEMELIIKATVSQSVQGLSQVNQQLDKTVSSAAAASGAMAKASTGMNAISGAAAKASSALSNEAAATADIASATGDAIANTSKLSSAIEEGASNIAASNDAVVKSFDDISASVNKVADDIGSKFVPVIAETDEMASKLEQLPASLQGLGQGFQTNAISEGLASAAVAAGSLDSAIDNLVQQTATFLKLDGSVQQLLLSIEDLDPEMRKFAQDGTGSIAQLTAAFNLLKEKATFTTDPRQLLNYNLAIEQLGKQINNAKTSAAQFTPTLGKINPAANTAGFAVQNLGRVLQDLPFGFIGIANNLNPLLESFQRLQAESKSTGTSLTQNLLSSLTGAGGLGLALSAVTAGLTLASFGMSAWTRGFGGAKSAVDEATKANEDYVKSLENINKQAVETSQKEITGLQSLVNVAKDSAASYQARIDAVIKLQEQFPEYFGNLSKEKILYGDITDAINKTSDALINKSLADAASNKAAEAGARVFDLIEKRKESIAELTAAQDRLTAAEKNGIPSGGQFTAVDKAKNALKDINALFFQAQLDQETFLAQATNYTRLSGAVTGAGDKLKSVDHILKDLDQSIVDLNRKSIALNVDVKDEKITTFKTAINDLLKTGLPATGEVIQGLVQKVKDLGGSFDTTSKKVNDISKILDQLKRDREDLTGDWKILQVDKPLKDIDLIESAIKKLEGLKGTESIIVKLKAEIDAESLAAIGGQLQKKFGSLKDLKLPDVEFPPIKAPIEFVAPNEEAQFAQLKEQVRNISEKLQITLPVNFEALNKEELKAILDAIPSDKKIKIGIDADQSGFKKFVKDLTESQNALDNLNKSILSTSIGTLTDAFADFGKAIGEGKNPFAALFQSFAKGLEELGKALIEYGVLRGIINKIFASSLTNPLAPALAIAAGIGLEALGSLLESKVHFAEGGIVTAPVLGLIGERGREVVIPLDRMSEFFKADGSTTVMIPEHRISGQDIVIAYKRAERHNNRTY